MNIAIIGGGQLGSRHLQACAALSAQMHIHLVDPSDEARKIAEERYHAVATGESPSLTLANDCKKLPDRIDLAIVATTANTRLRAMTALSVDRHVENWLLEKVLFQDLAEYDRAATLLGDSLERTWVNCAQRLWPFFINLKQQFGGDPDLKLEVSGSNWGLGCNAVHNTDIAAFLWNDELVHRAEIDPVVHDSKRPGFSEFTGLLETSARGGGHVRQLSYARGETPFTFTATHPHMTMIWDVGTSTVMRRDQNTDWKWEQSELIAPFQSVLTTKIVKDILAGSDCGLPRYPTAAKVHLGTLGALLDAAARNGNDLGSVCPVT